MALYSYEAFNKNGTIVRGEFEGESENEVVDHLERKALQPTSIRVVGGTRHDISFSFSNTISPVDTLFFIRNLSTMLKAGMSMSESLDILIRDAEHKPLRDMLQRVALRIRGGRSLSDAFEPYRDQFPAAFIGMIKAGELSGKLDATLASLGDYLSREFELRREIKGALMYPIILLTASIGVTSLLLIVVLPRLTQTFMQNKMQLPLITRIFMGMSSALTYSWVLDIAILAALVWFFTYFRKTKSGKKFWSELLFAAPVSRDIVKKIALVRFTRTFGSLINSGVSALETIDISADAVGNTRYSEALREAAKSVERGSPLSSSLAAHEELFPRILIGLVVVGERTGTLGEILLTLASFYEEEANAKLKNLTAIMEPALLLVMGLVVGSIALSILMPIYGMIGQIGG